MHTLNLPEFDGGVEILAATPPPPFAFRAKMAVDADGSARAYHPDNIGLDHIDNAGRPGNWWGIATHNGRPDGTPVVQTAEDPCPGYHVSTTALVDPAVSSNHRPARYVDSEKIPYVVLPRGGGNGARLGDFATAVHLESGRVVHAIYADIGPRNHYGEGSMALAEALGLSPNPRRGGTTRRVIAYVFYPLSGNGRPHTPDEIDREGARLFEEWGGIDRVRELFGGAGAGFGAANLEILSEPADDLSTLDGRIRAAEAALDLESLQSLRDAILEHSELRQEEGEMAPRVEVAPDSPIHEALGLSPEMAALGVGGMLGVVNRVVHAERWVRFVLDKRSRPHLPVIVAEGDSWFLHPLIHETLDCLREDFYNVRSLAAAGDTVENMLSSDQWLGPLAEEGAHAFLFSGGGNDFLGGGRIDGLVKREDTSKHPEQLVIPVEVDRLLGLIAGHYTRMLRRLRGDRPWVKVFSHGYDYVTRVDKGPWIWPYLERKGYSRERAVAVTAVLLDRFNRRMSALESREPNFRFISMIGTAGTDPSAWDDAIHPKAGGFRTVAGRFHRALKDFYRPAPAHSEATVLTIAPGWNGGDHDPTPDVDEASELDAPPAPEAVAAVAVPRLAPISAADVTWVDNHRNHPDYAHLPEAALGAEFELTSELLQQAIALGFYKPHFTAEGHLVAAIRGAALGTGQSVLRQSSVVLSEQKPDHRTFRCVIAVWHRSEGKISAFRASTVPNRGGVASAHNRYNGHGGQHANLLPTGCYELCVGTHYGSTTVPTVLRLGSGPEPSDALTVTVLRNRNDGTYGTRDFWDNCKPADNIHPAFRATSADFSSLGCLTLPGSYSNGSHSGLWSSFRETAGFDGNQHRGTRYDLLLTTGMELAAIHLGGSDLRRLSHGSVGQEVATLQSALGLATTDGVFGPVTKKRLAGAESEANGGLANGIYSLEVQTLLGFPVF